MTFTPFMKPHEKLSHTVAFRVTSAEFLELLPFFEVFDGQNSVALRWLLTQEQTKETMRAAVRQAAGG